MATPPRAEPAWQRLLRHAPPVLGLGLLIAAVTVAHREFKHLRFEDIARAIGRIPQHRLLLGFGLTICAYLVLTVYDLLGSIYAGHRLPYRRIAFASFCAYALSHNLGVSALSGGAVRFRLYAGWGFTPLQIGKLIGFCSVTFAFGAMVLGGAALILAPGSVPFLGGVVPGWGLRALGAGLWGAVLVYAALAARGGETRLFGHGLRLPRARMALGQVLLATTDMSVTASVLYVLLPTAAHLTYARFLGVYVLSYSAGVVASLPGGIGVFDTVLALGLATWLPAPSVLGAILIFRLFYYIIPLFLAGTLFAGHEVLVRGREVLRHAEPRPALEHWRESDFAIAAGTGTTALCGAMLLAMGVLAPSLDAGWLDPKFSPTMLAGHFVPSLIGAALLVFCIGLAQRVRVAWIGTIGLLLLAAASIALGAHLRVVPAILVLASFVLAPYRQAFHRPTRWRPQALQPGTVAALLALVVCVISLAVFERHVRYVTSNSWWRIVSSGDVPASVRLAVGLSVLVGVVALWRLLLPAEATAEAWTLETRMRYAGLGGAPPATVDGILFDDTGAAAIPFRRMGRVLLGLGDPAGAAMARSVVLWRLAALARREGRRLAIYGAGAALLDVYGGLGLAAVPLGANGLPQGDDGTRADAFLLCAEEADMEYLLQRLPDLVGREPRAATA